MEYNLDIRSSLVLIVTALNFAIGFLIYFRNRKNPTNLTFFIFALVVGFWGLSMIFFRLGTTIKTAELFSRGLYFWAGLIPLSFIYFIYYFPARELSLNFWQKYVLPIPTLVILFLSFKVNFLIETIFFVEAGENHIIFNKFYYTLYIIYMVGYFNYAYFLLFKKFLKRKSGTQRSQIGYVIIGTLLTTLIGTATNLLGPYFGYYELNWFGQVGLIAMIASIAYAILKYQLFNIKIILVELATLLLNFFLFINVFTSHGSAEFMLNISVFLSILLISILLMRAINKDIRDRERIVKLIADVESANELLKANEAQKTEFVSIASHQLRAPLTAIKGYASMILEGTFGQLLPDAREAMSKLYKSNEKVLSIVEDLLTVSRIEQGRMVFNLEMVNLSNFVNMMIGELRVDAKEANVAIHFRPDSHTNPLVSIDTKKFKQVVKHIIENAIQYTKNGGSVKIEVQNDRVAGKARLLVSDTGVGMTPEQISSILERSKLKHTLENAIQTGSQNDLIPENNNEKRIENTKKSTTGIGLYIVQEIIEAHHGTIHIESSGLGKGTTVAVELPMTEEYM